MTRTYEGRPVWFDSIGDDLVNVVDEGGNPIEYAVTIEQAEHDYPDTERS